MHAFQACACNHSAISPTIYLQALLVRYLPSGIYFSRMRVRGKLIRRSLKTNKPAAAKLRLLIDKTDESTFVTDFQLSDAKSLQATRDV